jgi:hypothetical protein
MCGSSLAAVEADEAQVLATTPVEAATAAEPPAGVEGAGDAEMADAQVCTLKVYFSAHYAARDGT